MIIIIIMQATLSPFLSSNLDLPITKIAVAFLVMSLASVLATPVFGWLCDSKVDSTSEFCLRHIPLACLV